MTELVPSNKELLNAFADYLNAGPTQLELTITTKVVGARAVELRRYVEQRSQLLQGHSKEEIWDVMDSHARSHALHGMTSKDRSLYPEDSFERAVLEAFLGFLQFKEATR